MPYVATLAGLTGGGAWAWYQYKESGAIDWQNNIALKTDVLPYHDNLRLLVVHVESRNLRPNKFELRTDHHDSLQLRVRRLAPNATEGQVFKEDEGDLIARSDLPALVDGDYEFLPAAEMDNRQAVVVKADTLGLDLCRYEDQQQPTRREGQTRLRRERSLCGCLHSEK